MKTFKISVIVFFCSFFLLSCSSVEENKKKDNPLKGTWKAIYNLPSGIQGIKSFTDSYFNWYYFTPEGNIISVGAGVYEFTSDSCFVETVQAEGPHSSYIGNKAVLDFEIRGDTLITKFTLVGNNYSERWLKVE